MALINPSIGLQALQTGRELTIDPCGSGAAPGRVGHWGIISYSHPGVKWFTGLSSLSSIQGLGTEREKGIFLELEDHEGSCSWGGVCRRPARS